ncbi:DUF3703 domain-containing protein [Rhodococcus gannanensis]|uniref:DUF3703 domain-containing protein n=1 Tax=Rhodococcus gannanensis TaxID=1960308 RepID=A0ABW4PC13_9NOCA
MPDRVHSAYEAEMYDARIASTEAEKWDHLELAHLMTESYPWPHVRTHVAMLALAARGRDRRAVADQLRSVVSVVTARGGHAARCRSRDESRPAPERSVPGSR